MAPPISIMAVPPPLAARATAGRTAGSALTPHVALPSILSRPPPPRLSAARPRPSTPPILTLHPAALRAATGESPQGGTSGDRGCSAITARAATVEHTFLSLATTPRDHPSEHVALPPLAPLPALASVTALLSLLAFPLPASALPLAAAWEAADDFLFAAAHMADQVVSLQLAALTPGGVAAVLLAGVLSALSPCTLAVLPLTVGYIAGYQGTKPQSLVAADAVCFALGLAASRAAMGVTAALAGRAYGQALGAAGGAGGAVVGALPVVAGGVAAAMGLNLLGLLPLTLPSAFGGFDAKEAAAKLPSSVQMFLAGAAFAFVASPCATPVLASLLAFVASTGDAWLGGGLLLLYTVGSAAPLMLAAAFTGSLKRLLALRQHALWVNPASGALLLAGGTYALLDHTFPLTGALPPTPL